MFDYKMFIDEKHLEYLLDTQDIADRDAIVDLILELGEELGAEANERVVEVFRTKATLQSLQTLLYGLVMESQDAIDVARLMIWIDLEEANKKILN